jgi:pyruvate dehydrogenase (quinone)/pyruvate oxidase
MIARKTAAIAAALSATFVLATSVAVLSAADAIPPYVTAAVNDGGRTPWDIARDSARHPAEVLAFSQIKPGMVVVDLIPGDAYYTRILAKLVGPKGKVYAMVPNGGVFTRNERMAQRQRVAPAYVPPDEGYACVLGCYPTGPAGYLLPVDNVQALEGITEYRDLVTVLWVDLAEFGGNFPVPEQVDAVFTADGYHDLHSTKTVNLPQYMQGRSGTLKPVNVANLDKSIFRALKPGGKFIVLDYVATSDAGFHDAEKGGPGDPETAPGHPGSVDVESKEAKSATPSVADALHRTPPDAVKAEITAAGFTFDGESKVLANPADDHTKPAAGPVASLDKNDQYLFRFSKPMNASAATKRPNAAQDAATNGTTWGNTTITNIDVKPGVSANGQRLRMSFFYPNHAYQEFGSDAGRCRLLRCRWASLRTAPIPDRRTQRRRLRQSSAGAARGRHRAQNPQRRHRALGHFAGPCSAGLHPAGHAAASAELRSFAVRRLRPPDRDAARLSSVYSDVLTPVLAPGRVRACPCNRPQTKLFRVKSKKCCSWGAPFGAATRCTRGTRVPPRRIPRRFPMNASDVLVETLMDWGVDVIFGIPGDGINGIIESLRVRKDKVRFVQVRHEEAAAFMACAYAKWTGKLGVCLATSGPGGIHLLNGLYDAKLDGQPVLAITGLQFHDLLHTHTQQDVELDKLYMDVCVYNARIMGAAHVQNVTELACRTALAYRGVSHITMPVDLQEQGIKDDVRSKRNRPNHVAEFMTESAHLPEDAQLAKAAEILNAGKKIAILAGRGALRAREEVRAVAERLAAPVAKPLLGKGVLPDTDPHSTGGTGLLGTRPSQEILESCDTLLIIGSSFPYIEFYPKPGNAKAVQIELDPKRIGLRYPVDAGLVGDSRRVLNALLPKLTAHDDKTFLSKAQDGMKAWRGLMEERGTRTDMPMKPQVVAHELNKLLSDDAIIATDSGTITSWAARHLDMRGNMMFSCSGNLATMACGLPYANAAAIAYPNRQVIGFVGDGGFTMLMGELATAVKYNLNVKIIVIKNNTLGQIKWEQMVFLGNPEYACELQPIDFSAVARGFGAHAFRIDDPKRCAETLREALSVQGPTVIEAVVDPNEPPMPPKIELSQSAHFAEALLKGTPHGGKIALTVLSDKVREII